MKSRQHILIAPLNWGLGHATRCIPIIDALLERGFKISLASDGRALALLKKEYPDLATFELPGYEVRYFGNSMTWSIARQLPKIALAVFKEKKAIRKIVESQGIDLIISDNRYGCRSSLCKNIFISHQINIAIPYQHLENLVNKINHYFIKLFDECWIPDFAGTKSLAGKLSNTQLPYQHVGPLSRFKKSTLKKEYDVIAVLSGPEPQRSILEEKIITQLQQVNIKALIVQGKTETLEQREINHQIKIVSFLTSRALNEAILKSEIVIARSGYSTIMDLVALGKKAILIPTPGQTEQEYLAKRLMKQQRFYFQQQDALDLKTALEQADKFIPCTLDSTRQNLLEEVLNKL